MSANNNWALILAAGNGTRLRSMTTTASGLLLGLVPEEIDPELGYILPQVGGASLALTVRFFVEKPPVDIARAVVARTHRRPCGWSDLGTPRRVAETLSRIGHSSAPAPNLNPSPYLSLAAHRSREASPS